MSQRQRLTQHAISLRAPHCACLLSQSPCRVPRPAACSRLAAAAMHGLLRAPTRAGRRRARIQETTPSSVSAVQVESASDTLATLAGLIRSGLLNKQRPGIACYYMGQLRTFTIHAENCAQLQSDCLHKHLNSGQKYAAWVHVQHNISTQTSRRRGCMCNRARKGHRVEGAEQVPYDMRGATSVFCTPIIQALLHISMDTAASGASSLVHTPLWTPPCCMLHAVTCDRLT